MSEKPLIKKKKLDKFDFTWLCDDLYATLDEEEKVTIWEKQPQGGYTSLNVTPFEKRKCDEIRKKRGIPSI